MNTDSALFGGSFDPVHRGHLHILHEVSLLTDIRRVIIVPALLSNFKQDTKPASFDQRMRMVELALEDYRDIYPGDRLEFIVSPIEGERGGVSYSSDTVRDLLPIYGNGGKIGFIIGDDIVPTLDKWHDFGFLKEHVVFHCFRRGGGEPVTHGADVRFYESSVLEQSSTGIREGDLSGLSPRVRRYVDAEGLYRA